MSRTFKKIAAFTLSEMLVVLLLTIIVVGLAFSVLGLVQKQMWDIQKNYEEKTTDNLLQQALWVDFNSNASIEFSNKQQALFLGNEAKEQSYRFYEGYILRGTDTLDTNFTVSKMFYKGVEVSNGFIDALELTNTDQVPKTLFIYKKNTATDFMN
jgi:competence protein ComGC